MPKLLTVDDSASMRQMVAFTLRDAGFEVCEAEDGLVALSLAEKQSFDLVLADVNMPNMDGISLIRALRGLPAYQYTPLLMLTTESTMERKQEGKAAGATGWIVKPFQPDSLVATIRRVLG
jgi:two-component system chemotaxis response regulator CheY